MIQAPKNFLKRLIKKPAQDLYWDVYGKTIKNPKLPPVPQSFLFVCKGNICRSPYAEHAAHKLANLGKWRRLHFRSAGLIVNSPERPPEAALQAAKEFGVNLGSHLSCSVNSNMISEFDGVFAMEFWHLQWLHHKFQKHSNKFFLMPLFDPVAKTCLRGKAIYNIADPYGRSHEEFKKCFARIDRCIMGLLKLV